ncbi:hypothetical protein J4443_02390 [Candidatus Woesearchaeota archaeon]|nr:hypothetical protein [Candidatus Woesearchaeota archaeon]
MTIVAELKKGDKVILDGEVLIVENIEFSKIGKMGKSKCRLEALNSKKEKKVFILQTDQEIELQ